jgi:carbonic anhydrase
MDKLIDGYRRFRAGLWQANSARYVELATRGQKPQTMIIGCSDARVDPAINFDTGPGDVFMVRNVANVVPPYAPDSDHHGTSAALEFAVKSLNVPNIAILGHAKCGGIRALVQSEPEAERTSDFIDLWMEVATPAKTVAVARARSEMREGDTDHVCRLCEMANVRVGLANLRTFPWIAEREARGEIVLHGLYFDITTGDLFRLNELNEFEKVAPE